MLLDRHPYLNSVENNSVAISLMLSLENAWIDWTKARNSGRKIKLFAPCIWKASEIWAVPRENELDHSLLAVLFFKRFQTITLKSIPVTFSDLGVRQNLCYHYLD